MALENIVPCAEKREKLESGDFKRVVVYDEDTVDLELSAKDSNLYSVLKKSTTTNRFDRSGRAVLY